MHGRAVVMIVATLSVGPLSGQELPVWRIERNPEVTIGAIDGPEGSVLVNVNDATVLGDGTIVLVDFVRNHFRMRYYDRSGQHLVSVGRYGDGPFETTVGVTLGRLEGDSVMIVGWDHRFSVFGPRGERVRSGRLDLPAAALPMAVIDGPTVVTMVSRPLDRRLLPGRTGRSASTVHAHHVPSGVTDSIARTSSGRTRIEEDGRIVQLPFEPGSTLAAGGSRVWTANMADAVVRGWSPGGVVEVTVPGQPMEVDGDDEERWKEYELGIWPEERRERIAAGHRSLEFPDVMPRIQSTRAADDGSLWILRFEPPWSEEPYRWDVFGPDGTRIAIAEAAFGVLGGRPRGLFGGPFLGPVLHIGPDGMLIRTLGEFDDVRISRHRILRPGR